MGERIEQNACMQSMPNSLDGLFFTITLMSVAFFFTVYGAFPACSTFASLTCFPFSIVNSLKVEVSVSIEFPIVLPAHFCTYLALRRCT